MNRGLVHLHKLSTHLKMHLSCRLALIEAVCFLFVAFVEDNATISSIRYFENLDSYFVQNRRKSTLLNSFLYYKKVFRLRSNI